jgi:hypothetical protein
MRTTQILVVCALLSIAFAQAPVEEREREFLPVLEQAMNTVNNTGTSVVSIAEQLGLKVGQSIRSGIIIKNSTP